MGLTVNFRKFIRFDDVIALVKLLIFAPGEPTQIYMSYAATLINTWKKDKKARIFAIGRQFEK